MHIGKRIKEVREKRGKTLLEVANQLGVSEATVQRYESGNIKNLKLDTITNIAMFLNVNPMYLMGWDEKEKDLQLSSNYRYYPTPISAGLPLEVDCITENNVETISLPDSIMGKWAGRKDIYIMRINGDSMNKVMPHNSLIAVKPIERSELKDNDIVVYSDGGDYAVKRFYKLGDELIFRPDSTDISFSEYRTTIDNDELIIHGRVVLYIVELD